MEGDDHGEAYTVIIWGVGLSHEILEIAGAEAVATKQEMRRRMHQPIPVQGKWLQQVVSGYFNYHAVPTNSRALHAFRHFVAELWQRSLRRRSQKHSMSWERFTQLANDWLPKPRILHPWPDRRFAVKHPRWEPYA